MANDLDVSIAPRRKMVCSDDQNRVLRYIHRMQDGEYGCGFKQIMEYLCGSTMNTNSMQVARVRGSRAVDALERLGYVTIRTFLGMEEFQITDKGKIIAARLKI